MNIVPDPKKKEKKKKPPLLNRFQAHSNVLIWKCYLQRQRRWGILVVEAVFALVLFLAAIFIAKPVFLKPLQAEPIPPLTTDSVLNSFRKDELVGYAPNNVSHVIAIMIRAAELLNISDVWSAPTEDDLNEMLYSQSKDVLFKKPIIWVIWKPREGNIWALTIRSTERARYIEHAKIRKVSNPHLKAGFLAVQLAISQAIIEHVSETPPDFEVTLVAMPVSPMMEEQKVVRALSGILLCFTLALMPPVLETEALVVTETMSRFKRALRLRNVQYSSMYAGWLVYAYLTCLPICLLASITLILIFRWIHLVEALVVVLAYESVMIMLAMLMCMFHKKGYIACVWTTLFTLLQTYLAELLVHHQYGHQHSALRFFLHLILPPMGLVHAFNEFAVLQTEHVGAKENTSPLLYMVASWTLMNLLYFAILMILQRTIGQHRAIGGQVSWKSIIFKEVENRNELRHIKPPSGSEIGKLQEVDEFVAKAISFRDVSKSIMGVPVLSNITFDIYRGEFTILLATKTQETMMNAIEDMLTGLMAVDQGTIAVLGKTLKPGKGIMTTPQMMGYCHRSEALIEDLTVLEHLTLYSRICLWKQTKLRIDEYSYIRSKRLLKECDLESVKHEQVRNLNIYYKAQLCWAIAILLEPRVIVIPDIVDLERYNSVIKDKIMQYKTYKTIVSFYFSSLELEYADRVFVFDTKIMVFGGTPAYMFFRYGREYRARMTLRSSATSEEKVQKLLDRVELAGAKVRAHLGSLIILRLPVSPSERVAELVKDLNDNSNMYGLTSFDISVADSDEVCRRAIADSRAIPDSLSAIRSTTTLNNFTEHIKWKRQTSPCNIHLGVILSKFFKFHMNHIKLFAITFISAVLSGLFLGYSLSTALLDMDKAKIPSVENLSVEYLEIATNLVLRADNSLTSRSIAKGYIMSDTNATKKQIKNMVYTALPHTESLTEYLATRAIDSPQVYVYKYAYGMDVSTASNGKVEVHALYSPIHHDHGAAARSLARVYMALIRHYTDQLDATIKIVDDPLVLDFSLWTKDVDAPPLFIQFLLILTNSHFTLIPSQEHGLIRHVQKHAMNFSPCRYWFTLYFCDLLLYWLLVAVISLVMLVIMFLNVQTSQYVWIDILIVPFMLSVYGIGCIPQAYIFSLGPQMALNTMTFVIVNLVFGEATIIAKVFYGDALSYIMDFMTLSPQFNMAYAYVKIEQIYKYNNQCFLTQKSLCSVNIFHKCCEKCGVLQECFSRKSYFNPNSGIVMEITAMFMIATFFTVLLLLIEYRIFHRLWNATTSTVANRDKPSPTTLSAGYLKEKKEVLDKTSELYKPHRPKDKVNTFGEYLLLTDLTKRHDDMYMVHNVYLGVGKGEAVAVAGLRVHGRDMLCEILAGYHIPCAGNVWSMSKNKLMSQPHKYSQQVSISSDSELLPPWLSLREALALIAALRGVPKSNIPEEVHNHIEALELHSKANIFISEMARKDRTRLHFAAAVIGAPPVIVLDDCCVYQRFSVRRAMYFILNTLRKRGHAILICSGSIESHMPVTNRLAIMVDGTIFDVDTVDKLVERYSEKGYTVVVHLKDEVDINIIFAKYFTNFEINDTTEVLVNVQVKDPDLTWAGIFEKMEALKAENREVYSYIVTGLPIDYIYNSIIKKGSAGMYPAKGLFSCKWLRKLLCIKSEITPTPQVLHKLVSFERKYDITTLKELPWSVIFHR